MQEGYEGVYVVGVGQTAYEKRTTKTLHRILWEALAEAVHSARLSWQQIDGLGVTSFALPPDNVTTLAEHFGIEARWLFQGLYGGASGIINMLHGARAIQAGDAKVVACLTADVFDVASHNEMLDRFNGPLRDYLSPYAFGGANGVFALHTRLYMEEHGATREDFGRLAVAQRKNAQHNPNALFRGKTLSMEEYLNARQIADPLRLFDCVHPCAGGDCIILAHESIARDLGVPLVKILGGGEMHNYPANDVYSLRGGWEAFRDRMYGQAKCGPQDLHFAQLYDDYPVMEFIQLEGMGICERGKVAEFLRETDVTVHGGFPINTGGGQLSAGQAGASGGMIGVVEGVLQLRGEAAERQVACERGVVAGYGLVAYGRGLSSSAAILAKA
ncbi:MAG TPA: thiolase family protein [Hyphomicrobiaceae bacterium]